MIVCCGEALIDMLPRRTSAGENAFAPYPGGALFNSAIALGRLGAPTGFFSGMSSDFFGDMLRATLAQSQVDTRFCAISGRPATLAFVRFEDGHARYTFYDEATAGRMLSESDLPDFGKDVTALLFGAVSLINEPCGGTYETLMRRERERRVIMLDPNIRSNFIRDRESHLSRMERMIGMADIVKVSDEDVAWFGVGNDLDAIAAHWLARGPRLIVVTLGADGAVGFMRQAKVTVPGIKVTVADTVGAGDTVNAGLLAGLFRAGLLSKPAIAVLDADQLRDCLSLGVRAAAVTVSRPGANPPWAHEVEG